MTTPFNQAEEVFSVLAGETFRLATRLFEPGTLPAPKVVAPISIIHEANQPKQPTTKET